MDATQSSLSQKFDLILLAFVGVCAVLILINVGNNLTVEMKQSSLTEHIQPVKKTGQIDRSEAVKSFDLWMRKTSGGRLVKD
jgi:hypothetical protein